MKRPIVGYCIAYSLGIGGCYFLSYWLFWGVPILMLACLLLWWKKFLKQRHFKQMIVLILLFATGLLYSLYLTKSIEKINQSLLDYEFLESKYIAEKIEKTESGYQITARLLSIKQFPIHSMNKIKVNLFCDDIKNLSVADCFVASGVMKSIETARNPGGFNARNYFYAKKIYLKSTIKDFQIIQKEQGSILQLLMNIQNSLKKKINDIFPAKEAAIMNMMILGDHQDVGLETKKLYQIGGISHLLAISGLHITFLGYCIYMGLRSFVQSIKTSVVLSLFVIWIYCLITGGSSSAVRACLMFSLVLLSYIFGEKYDVYTSLFTAALIILFCHPFCLFDLGFQLSFGALFGIVSIKETMNLRYNPWENKLIELIYVSLSASLMTLPIILNSFHAFPSYSLIVNTCLVPSSSMLIGLTVLGIMAAFISNFFGQLIVGLAYFILKSIEWICKLIEKMPFAYIVLKEMTWTVIVLYFLSIFAFFSSRKYPIIRKLRFVPVIALIIYLLTIQILQQDELTLSFLDVGQGDCCVIRSQDQVLIVDGGGLTGSKIKENTGTFILAPFLKSQGIQHINGIFITHSDFDHIYGIIEIIDLMKIDFIALPLPYQSEKDPLVDRLVEKMTEKNIRLLFLAQGQNYEWKDLKLQCLYPKEEKGYYPNNNAKSMVLKLAYHQFDALLTGDIEKLQEEELVKANKDLSCELIKVPHHGSKTSSTEELIKSVDPVVAIFSYGASNLFGHPGDEVVKRYEDSEVNCFHTAQEGAILVKTDGETYEVMGYINGRKEEFECKH